jgi:D-alanine-D-alanine ligase
MARKLNIAIVYNDPMLLVIPQERVTEEPARPKGGRRKERISLPVITAVDVSLSSVEEEIAALETALLSLGYKVNIVVVDQDIHFLVNRLKSKKPDLIFNLCESIDGKPFQEVNVAGIYELLGIPYTGASALSLGWTADKIRTKETLVHHGLPTPRYSVYDTCHGIRLDATLGLPAIVKPAYEDASNGIDNSSVVWSKTELRNRIRYVSEKFRQPVLVEEYIDGRELHVAIIGNADPTVFPIAEIDFSGMPAELHNIMSYDAKWMPASEAYTKTTAHCPAGLLRKVEAEVKQVSLRAFRVMDCRDYARVDIRLSADNIPYVIEVNPNPDLSRNTEFVQSVMSSGLLFEQVIERIVKHAFERTI